MQKIGFIYRGTHAALPHGSAPVSHMDQHGPTWRIGLRRLNGLLGPHA